MWLLSLFLEMQESLEQLFELCGFARVYTRLHDRTVENRGLATTMERRWIQGVFQLTGASFKLSGHS